MAGARRSRRFTVRDSKCHETAGALPIAELKRRERRAPAWQLFALDSPALEESNVSPYGFALAAEQPPDTTTVPAACAARSMPVAQHKLLVAWKLVQLRD